MHATAWTPPSLLSMQEHIKNDTDIVFIEYAVNDPYRSSDSTYPIRDRYEEKMELRARIILQCMR